MSKYLLLSVLALGIASSFFYLDSSAQDSVKNQALKEKAIVDTKWEKKADLNKDGIVDPFEMRKWKQLSRPENPGVSYTSSGGQESTTETTAVVDSTPKIKPISQVDTKWEKKADANKDGVVDKTEVTQVRGPKDVDNNPPGPKGGKGTNWENQPGPKGGPGASPDKKPKAGARK